MHLRHSPGFVAASVAPRYTLTPRTFISVHRNMSDGPPQKRLKLDTDPTPDLQSIRAKRTGFLASLTRPVTPPQNQSLSSTRQVLFSTTSSSHKSVRAHSADISISQSQHELSQNEAAPARQPVSGPAVEVKSKSPSPITSPFHLTRVRDLPTSDNVDTISLHDILGDPLIKEAWIFNFCFDVDWLMQHFDPDVRDLVKVKIIHGSWRKDDLNKIGIDEACRRRSNVEAIQAWLPDPFGTHHSKMFILFRHDDQAQVVIHTANMLSKDWMNMTQAVWRSPLLPLTADSTKEDTDRGKLGTGSRFKSDLSRYVGAYGSRLKSLSEQLLLYDFQRIRAALIASVPAKFQVSSPDDQVWGFKALERALHVVPKSATSSNAHHVYQVSSIASLPTLWLDQTLFTATGGTAKSTSIIFPTSGDVADSLDGYAAGGSIHMRIKTGSRLSMGSLVRSQLNRWTKGTMVKTQSGRHLAAPHIKTYICFASKPTQKEPAPDINWALVTSANLSTQAWGASPKVPKGQDSPAKIHVQSFEIGVLVWPQLFAEGDEHVRMVPTFKRDTPCTSQSTAGEKLVGFRMPYDLPLTHYSNDEVPWSPQAVYDVPDRHGRRWPPDETW